eukprot:3283044-Alexandrium_andersonii.AAC.1
MAALGPQVHEVWGCKALRARHETDLLDSQRTLRFERAHVCECEYARTTCTHHRHQGTTVQAVNGVGSTGPKKSRVHGAGAKTVRS